LQEFWTQNQPFFNDIWGGKTSMKTAFWLKVFKKYNKKNKKNEGRPRTYSRINWELVMWGGLMSTESHPYEVYRRSII
jgi:hypothetical protein